MPSSSSCAWGGNEDGPTPASWSQWWFIIGYASPDTIKRCIIICLMNVIHFHDLLHQNICQSAHHNMKGPKSLTWWEDNMRDGKRFKHSHRPLSETDIKGATRTRAYKPVQRHVWTSTMTADRNLQIPAKLISWGGGGVWSNPPLP